MHKVRDLFKCVQESPMIKKDPNDVTDRTKRDPEDLHIFLHIFTVCEIT
jgi:hypothetical protein